VEADFSEEEDICEIEEVEEKRKFPNIFELRENSTKMEQNESLRLEFVWFSLNLFK